MTDVMGIMPWNDGKQAELSADCLAGEAARNVRPDRVDKEEQALQYAVGGDPYHGTTEQRVDAFMHGAKIGSCTSYLVKLPR